MLDVFDEGSCIYVLSADLWLLFLMEAAADPLEHLVSLHRSIVGLAVHGQRWTHLDSHVVSKLSVHAKHYIVTSPVTRCVEAVTDAGINRLNWDV